jgi:hypothetical protein
MKFRFKNGAILLHRVGPMNAQRQIHESAPCRRGVYAFVWPFFDPYFVWHQLDLYYVPKRLTYDTIDKLWIEKKEDEAKLRGVERSAWELEHKVRIKRLMRPKKIWWNKPFWSRIPPKHELDTNKHWYYWTDLRGWAKQAMTQTKFQCSPYYFPDTTNPKPPFKLILCNAGADAFEVVLPM